MTSDTNPLARRTLLRAAVASHALSQIETNQDCDVVRMEKRTTRESSKVRSVILRYAGALFPVIKRPQTLQLRGDLVHRFHGGSD